MSSKRKRVEPVNNTHRRPARQSGLLDSILDSISQDTALSCPPVASTRKRSRPSDDEPLPFVLATRTQSTPAPPSFSSSPVVDKTDLPDLSITFMPSNNFVRLADNPVDDDCIDLNAEDIHGLFDPIPIPEPSQSATTTAPATATAVPLAATSTPPVIDQVSSEMARKYGLMSIPRPNLPKAYVSLRKDDLWARRIPFHPEGCNSALIPKEINGLMSNGTCKTVSTLASAFFTQSKTITTACPGINWAVAAAYSRAVIMAYEVLFVEGKERPRFAPFITDIAAGTMPRIGLDILRFDPGSLSAPADFKLGTLANYERVPRLLPTPPVCFDVFGDGASEVALTDLAGTLRGQIPADSRFVYPTEEPFSLLVVFDMLDGLRVSLRSFDTKPRGFISHVFDITPGFAQFRIVLDVTYGLSLNAYGDPTPAHAILPPPLGETLVVNVKLKNDQMHLFRVPSGVMFRAYRWLAFVWTDANNHLQSWQRWLLSICGGGLTHASPPLQFKRRNNKCYHMAAAVFRLGAEISKLPSVVPVEVLACLADAFDSSTELDVRAAALSFTEKVSEQARISAFSAIARASGFAVRGDTDVSTFTFAVEAQRSAFVGITYAPLPPFAPSHARNLREMLNANALASPFDEYARVVLGLSG